MYFKGLKLNVITCMDLGLYAITTLKLNRRFIVARKGLYLVHYFSYYLQVKCNSNIIGNVNRKDCSDVL